MKNRYGLDIDYFESKINLIARDIGNYRPDEIAREFARLSKTADENVMKEHEFSDCDKLKKEIKRLRLENEQLRSAVADVWNLIDYSCGVAGVDSSDVMPWCAMLRGGRCEEWLGNFSDVSERFLE